MNTKNKVLLSSLISMAVLSLTACGGGDSTPEAQHPDPDFFSPNITLNGGDIVIEEGTTYIDAGATASDNVDGDNVNVTTSGFVDANTAGTYTMTYSATDVAGNAAEATRSIKVIRGTDFNDFNGSWRLECQDTSSSDLNDRDVTVITQIITVDNRDIKYRVRGYEDAAKCISGDVKYNGLALGRVVYTGQHVTGSYTGEKVDIVLDSAKVRGPNATEFHAVDTSNPANFGLSLPFYNILVKANDSTLYVGKTMPSKDGSNNAKRPVEFDVQDAFEKL